MRTTSSPSSHRTSCSARDSPALLSLKVIDTQAVREHSDHAVLVARYDLATVSRVLSTAR
ncbi:hypothetical protein ACIQJX_26420 [Streptomyces griseoviridis]